MRNIEELWITNYLYKRNQQNAICRDVDQMKGHVDL
jgi:hypothetical protein